MSRIAALRTAGVAVGGDGEFEFLAERGDEDEAGGGVWYFTPVFPPRAR